MNTIQLYKYRKIKVLDLFTTKHKDWEYEEEYRIIYDKGDILQKKQGQSHPSSSDSEHNVMLN